MCFLIFLFSDDNDPVDFSFWPLQARGVLFSPFQERPGASFFVIRVGIGGKKCAGWRHSFVTGFLNMIPVISSSSLKHSSS